MSKIIDLKLACVPNSNVSGATLLQTENDQALVFNAQKQGPNGTWLDAGHAVVRFEGCLATKFGYPNDEAWFGFPEYKGLTYGIYEVLDSPWCAEISLKNRHSFPNKAFNAGRHFLFLFHDSCFECAAKEMTVETTFELWELLWPKIYQRVLRYAGS